MIRVLGPLQVGGEASAPVEVGSPRHREVLAALVVDAGRVVSTDALLERVWGEGARGGTAANLQAIISRLRSRLRPVAGVEIVTAPPGYRLDLAEGTLDADRFLDRLRRARRSQADDPAVGRREVDEALAEWRGAAYADIPQPFAEAEAARLDGQRLVAHELAAELDLALGRNEEVVARVPALVAEHPLREGLRALLMTALYRTGRQADALAEYGAVREVLAEELGLDPGPDLQGLHQRILEQDPALLGPAPVPAATPEPPVDRPVATAPVSGLPAALAPHDTLVGRDGEVDYLRSLLEGSTQRLVTLTGVGGVGKTRLALAAAAAASGSFADGTAVTSLAPVTDPDLVLPEIARAVGLSGADVPDPLAGLAEHLRTRRMLLVLDNAEHLLDAAPDVSRLVAACPGVTALVTSRTPLRVRGEVQYPVPPLALPDPEADGATEVGRSAAVALFVERARAVAPGFAMTDDDAAAVSALCRRLAGIPLAIELAAARVRLMPPAALLARLDDVLAAGGARDLPPRQRTMRATLDWSHDLLEPEEQRLFRRLSVFAGGFTLDAAEAVTAAPNGDGTGVLAGLEALVEHSLVVPEPGGPEPRYRMLEPIHQYAAARLSREDAAGEAPEVRAAHRRYFRQLVTDVAPSFQGPGTAAGLARTQREHANIVAALESGLSDGDPELTGRMLWDLWLFWWLQGHLVEGRRITGAVLAQPTDAVPNDVRVRALAVHAAMAFAQGDLETAARWTEGAALAGRTGDLAGQAHCVAGEGLVAIAAGDLPAAEQALRDTVPLCEAVGERGGWMWTLTHVWLATVTLLRGDPQAARPLVGLALEAARARHDVLATYIGLFTAAQIELAVAAPEAARPLVEEGIALSTDTGDLANLAYFLDTLGVVESAAGHHHRVAVLHGAAASMRETVGAVVYGYYQPDQATLDAAIAAAREALGDREFAAAVTEGAALDMAAAVALAVG